MNTISKKGVNKGILKHSKYINIRYLNLENIPTVFDSFEQSSLT